MGEHESSIGTDRIDNSVLAEEAIRRAFEDAYKAGWHPDNLDSVGIVSQKLAEVCRLIDGRLLDRLAEDSTLRRIRADVVWRIRAGEMDADFFNKN